MNYHTFAAQLLGRPDSGLNGCFSILDLRYNWGSYWRNTFAHLTVIHGKAARGEMPTEEDLRYARTQACKDEARCFGGWERAKNAKAKDAFKLAQTAAAIAWTTTAPFSGAPEEETIEKIKQMCSRHERLEYAFISAMRAAEGKKYPYN